MIARMLLILALVVGTAAMARGMAMPGTMTCATEAACCPDGKGAVHMSDCTTCCAVAPVTFAFPPRSEMEPVAVRAAAPVVLIPHDVRPLDPPPRSLGQTDISI